MTTTTTTENELFTADERDEIMVNLWKLVQKTRKPLNIQTLVAKLNKKKIDPPKVFQKKLKTLLTQLPAMKYYSRGIRAQMIWATKAWTPPYFMKKLREQAHLKCDHSKRIVGYQSFEKGGRKFGVRIPTAPSDVGDDEEEASEDVTDDVAVVEASDALPPPSEDRRHSVRMCLVRLLRECPTDGLATDAEIQHIDQYVRNLCPQ